MDLWEMRRMRKDEKYARGDSATCLAGWLPTVMWGQVLLVSGARACTLTAEYT